MSHNILIVDHSAAMRRVVRRVTDLSGLEVGNGKEALAILRAEWVDLIVRDINMPNLDGEQLLLAVCEDSMLANIPVLVVSTDQCASRIEGMIGQGTNGYLSNLFMTAALSAQFSRLLGATPNAAF